MNTHINPLIQSFDEVRKHYKINLVECYNVSQSLHDFIVDVPTECQIVCTYLKGLIDTVNTQIPIEMVCAEQLKEIINDLSNHLEAKATTTKILNEIDRCKHEIQNRKSAMKNLFIMNPNGFPHLSGVQSDSLFRAPPNILDLYDEIDMVRNNMDNFYSKTETFVKYSDILDININRFLSFVNEHIMPLYNQVKVENIECVSKINEMLSIARTMKAMFENLNEIATHLKILVESFA